MDTVPALVPETEPEPKLFQSQNRDRNKSLGVPSTILLRAEPSMFRMRNQAMEGRSRRSSSSSLWRRDSLSPTDPTHRNALLYTLNAHIYTAYARYMYI